MFWITVSSPALCMCSLPSFLFSSSLKSLWFSVCNIVVVQFVKHAAAGDPLHKKFKCHQFYSTTFRPDALCHYYSMFLSNISYLLFYSFLSNFHIFSLISYDSLAFVGYSSSPICANFWGPKSYSSYKAAMTSVASVYKVT